MIIDSNNSHLNIKLTYLYRDGGNYKQWNEVIFSNAQGRDLIELEDRIRCALIDGEYFYAEKWGLKDMHYFKWDDSIDHLFHEFHTLSETSDMSDMPIDITDFLELIETVPQ